MSINGMYGHTGPLSLLKSRHKKVTAGFVDNRGYSHAAQCGHGPLRRTPVETYNKACGISVNRGLNFN
jgi:hypothetical protein